MRPTCIIRRIGPPMRASCRPSSASSLSCGQHGQGPIRSGSQKRSTPRASKHVPTPRTSRDAIDDYGLRTIWLPELSDDDIARFTNVYTLAWWRLRSVDQSRLVWVKNMPVFAIEEDFREFFEESDFPVYCSLHIIP